MTQSPEIVSGAQTSADLRKFALAVGGMFVLVFGLLLPWIFGFSYPAWPWGLLLVLIVWSLTHVRSFVHFQSAWMCIALAIGKVNNAIILGLVFGLLITPMGWVRRTFGHDPIAKRFDPSAQSYRKNVSRPVLNRFGRPY